MVSVSCRVGPCEDLQSSRLVAACVLEQVVAFGALSLSRLVMLGYGVDTAAALDGAAKASTNIDHST